MSFPGSSCLSFWVSSAKRPSRSALSSVKYLSQSLEFARAITMCRVFSLAFWSQAFAELKARSGSSFVGVVVLAVEAVAVVLAVELLAAASPKGGRKKDQ